MSAGTPQFIQQFPSLRMRRMRRDEFSRRLMRETSLAADHFIYPVFVQDGTNKRHAVASMPGVERHTIDKLFEVAEKCLKAGVPVMATGLPAVWSRMVSLVEASSLTPETR